MRNYIVVAVSILICGFALATEDATEANVEQSGSKLPFPRVGCTYDYHGGARFYHQDCEKSGLVPTEADVNGGSCLDNFAVPGLNTSPRTCKKASYNVCDQYTSIVNEPFQCREACQDYHAFCCCPPEYINPNTSNYVRSGVKTSSLSKSEESFLR
eukprot:CAMPEP_0194419284 /NCGR_PEP_ID=MMETSP0176-20130528/18489_1 /TAXON_ID=216777 /ORGANISM="Proboscia alata, Strain PI-D3" /LENGTH=155 /DNA_ID=CAMNT_0039226209 /DNA_START=597 /DNA_END=1064 /DNA_ORIENTATION=-